jgi:hypothetical protein
MRALRRLALSEKTPNVPALDLPALDIVSTAKGFRPIFNGICEMGRAVVAHFFPADRGPAFGACGAWRPRWASGSCRSPTPIGCMNRRAA